MNRRTPHRHLLLPLLGAALTLPACEPLRERPDTPTREEPLTVALESSGASCREGQVTLSASIGGGTASKVVLLQDEQELETLSAPYRYTLDCATHPEGRFSFRVKAWSGNQGFDSSPTAVVVDRTRPQVTGWRPGTRFPSMDEPMEIVFSESIDPHSLGDAPTLLRDDSGARIAHQAVLLEDGKVLRLVPAAPIHPPARLFVELLQRDLTDLAGNPLSEQSSMGTTWRFDYWPFARMRPSPSEQLISDVTPASSTRGGAPFVAFAELPRGEEDNARRQLAVSRWNDNTKTWERLPAPREEGASPPEQLQLELGVGGWPVLAWCEESCGSVSVKQFNGTSWVSLGEPLQTKWRSMRMTVDPLGSPVLLLGDRDFFLRVVHWNGAGWVELGSLPTTSTQTPVAQASASGIAVDTQKVVVAWTETEADGLGSRVFVAQYQEGAWSFMGEPFQANTSRVHHVSVALDGQRRPLVAWSEWSPGAMNVALNFSRWESHAGWSPPEQLDSGSQTFPLGRPLLAVDDDGEPWVAWNRDGGPYGSEIYYRRHLATGWGPEQLVAAGSISGFRLNPHGFPWVATDQELLLPQ